MDRIQTVVHTTLGPTDGFLEFLTFMQNYVSVCRVVQKLHCTLCGIHAPNWVGTVCLTDSQDSGRRGQCQLLPVALTHEVCFPEPSKWYC